MKKRKRRLPSSVILDPRVIDLWERATEALEGSGKEYAIGGGIAMIALGLPRSTEDVDVFALEEARPAVLRALRDQGLSVTKRFEPYHYEAFDPDHHSTRIRVDVLFPVDDPEVSAVLDATTARLGKFECQIFKAKWLALSKFYSDPKDRPGDFKDIARMLNEGAFDPDECRETLALFHEEMLGEWDEMMRELRRTRGPGLGRPKGRTFRK